MCLICFLFLQWLVLSKKKNFSPYLHFLLGRVRLQQPPGKCHWKKKHVIHVLFLPNLKIFSYNFIINCKFQKALWRTWSRLSLILIAKDWTMDLKHIKNSGSRRIHYLVWREKIAWDIPTWEDILSSVQSHIFGPTNTSTKLSSR